MRTHHRLGVAVAALCIVAAGAARAQTAGDVEWSGGAGSGNPYWNVTNNWSGGLYPSNPTPGIIYLVQAGYTFSTLDADRQVGGIYFGIGPYGTPEVQHTINLNGHKLTVAGDIWRYVDASKDWLKMTNGTLQVGTDSVAGNIKLDSAVTQERLILGPAVVFDAYNVHTISIGYRAQSYGAWGDLDLRGTEVTGGVLAMTNLLVRGKYAGVTGKFCGVYLNSATTLSSIEIANELRLGDTESGGYGYIGDPANGGKLPPGISIRVGESPAARGKITISKFAVGGANDRVYYYIVASGGGAFTAYVSSLDVTYQSASALPTYCRGTLDIGAMTNCLIDAELITVGSDRYNASPSAARDIRGTLTLCPGVVTAGEVEIGATLGDGDAYGLLSLSNTSFTVTNTITLNQTGDVICHIGETPSGFDIANTGAGALSIHSNATLTITFTAPNGSLPHYGLAWAGDHIEELTAMVSAGKLVIDDAGLDGATASVYYGAGATYLGLPPPAGSLMVIR